MENKTAEPIIKVVDHKNIEPVACEECTAGYVEIDGARVKCGYCDGTGRRDERYGVEFTIGVQTFRLQLKRTEAEAEWFAEQLKHAFGVHASQQCAELQKRIELLERDLIQETGKCMKYQHEIATSPLQSENESLKKRVSELEYTLRQARGLTNYIPVELEHHAKNIEKAIELALNPLS